MPVLALKVDIDTFHGMQNLPRITGVLEKRGIRASFFISFGPDRSGLAIVQLLRPRFAFKMLRTGAPSMYGWRTALYGTLLKAPMIGCAFPERIRELGELGHETACHAWDHRLWQDWLPFMSMGSVRKWLGSMVDAFIEVTGSRPAAFGAPGWRVDSRALGAVAVYGFSYLSCTRAAAPFVFEENRMLEVPSNLPCIEEVGAAGVLDALGRNAASETPWVLPVHAEVEGGRYLDDFERILDRALSLGYTTRRVCDIAEEIDRASLPVRGLKTRRVPHRAFKCAV